MKSKTRKILADDGFNPELVLGARFEGILKFPCIEAHRDIIVPESLIPFSKIEKYGSNGRIMIKAHPRDDMDYGRLFPEATVIEKNMPMEVMNFDETICFEKAITVTSSAVNGLKYAKEKIYLGAEYLQSFKER